MNQGIALKNSLTKRILGGLVFGFVTLLVVLFLGDIRQVGSVISSFDWQLVPAVIGLTMFNYTLRFGKWHFYLQEIGAKNLPLLDSARLFVAGFPLAMTPGKVGEALKGVWLNREADVPVAAGIAVVAAERVSDGLAVLMLSSLGIIAHPNYWPAFAAILTILLGGVVISQVPAFVNWLLDQFEKLPWVGRYASSLRSFYQSSYLLFRPKATLIATGLGTISWLGEGIGFYLVLIGLGIQPGWVTLSNAVFILAFSTVIGAVSTLPGGLGAAEASIAGMLMLIMGLDSTTAAAATLLIRLATLWFGISLGLAVWALSPDLLGLANHSVLPRDGEQQQ